MVGMPRPDERAARLPAPAVRRTAPARHDRDGAGLRAEAADRRRADHRARRDDPGPDPRPARPAQARARDGDHPDHPRHGSDRRPGRPRAGHVRRTQGRDAPRPCALFAHVRHPYTEALLASIPQLDQDKTQQLYSIPGLPPDLRTAARWRAGSRPAARSPPSAAEPRIRRSAARTRTIRTPASIPRHSAASDMGELGASLLAAGRAEQGADRQPRPRARAARRGVGARRRRRPGTRNGSRVEPILEFRDVTKEFPVTAGAILSGGSGRSTPSPASSSRSGRGETFGLVGESGCGKTTLGRMGVALERPTAVRCCSTASTSARSSGARAPQAPPRPAVHVPGPLRLARPADARQGDHLRAARHRRPRLAAEQRPRPSAGCSTRSASATTRSTATRTSSPAASASASAWLGRWR